MTENIADKVAVGIDELELSEEELLEVAGGAFKTLPSKTGFQIYKILPGDTLSKIAKKYKCTVDDLMKWNTKIKNRNLIRAGDYLYIKK